MIGHSGVKSRIDVFFFSLPFLLFCLVGLDHGGWLWDWLYFCHYNNIDSLKLKVMH